MREKSQERASETDSKWRERERKNVRAERGRVRERKHKE